MQYNSSHAGGTVLEPNGELWTEYTHYGTSSLPITIRRSFYMPPNEQFYLVRYKITSDSAHTIDLFDTITSFDCNEQGRGSLSGSVGTIDQSYCMHSSLATSVGSVPSGASVSAGFGDGDHSSESCPLERFVKENQAPEFSEYNAFHVGYGALYKGLSVSSGNTVIIDTFRAFGSTLSDAKKNLEAATSKGADYWVTETGNRYTQWLSQGKQPPISGDELDLYKKSLLIPMY